MKIDEKIEKYLVNEARKETPEEIAFREKYSKVDDSGYHVPNNVPKCCMSCVSAVQAVSSIDCMNDKRRQSGSLRKHWFAVFWGGICKYYKKNPHKPSEMGYMDGTRYD